MLGLFRTILILALIYYGIRFLSRLLMPWLLKTFVRKVEKKMKDQQNQYSRNDGFEKEKDDVFIKRPEAKPGKSTKKFDGGEYIDFEEVEKDK